MSQPPFWDAPANLPDDPDPAGTALIEDLDPATPQEQARAGRWELIVGLVLVLGLAGFALIGWWDQQGHAGHYRAGSQAAAVFDWDTARAEFAAAAGYSDAATRLADAQTKIATRNSAYALVQAAAGRADWIGVLQALPPLQLIAPHYRDTDALQNQALAGATTAALTGTVALRLNVQPAGLYRFGAGGWRLLPASDSLSRVRARCPDGGVVYDVPATPGAGTQVVGGDPNTVAWAASPRELLRDSPARGPSARLVVDPDPSVTYICTAGALWTVRTFNAANTPLLNAIPAQSVRYQEFAASHPITATLPGPAWYIVGTAPAAGEILLLDTTTYYPPTWNSQFYLANADGSGRRLVLTTAGTLEQAAISPNGRYALLTLNAPRGPSSPPAQSVILVDLSGASAPLPLIGIDASVPGFDLSGGPAAVFLQQPPRANQVLVWWATRSQQSFRLLDPARPTTPLLETQLPPGARLSSIFGDPAGRSLVLLARPRSAVSLGSLAQPGPADGTVSAIEITADNQAHARVIAGQPAAGNWMRLDYLVTLNPAVAAPGGGWNYVGADGEKLALAVQPWPPTTTPTSQQIFTATQSLAALAPPLVPFRLAPNWLVYSAADGSLHGRTYDGTLDRVLPETAAAFSALDLLEEP